jgi:hypothetical protein
MFTDETILTFGKYKFTKLGKVPAEFLIRQFDNKQFFGNLEFKEYLELNIERIRTKQTELHTEIIEQENICDKFVYASEKIAKQSLRDINQVQQKHKKPVRAYECDKCGGWHLTSKTEWKQ